MRSVTVIFQAGVLSIPPVTNIVLQVRSCGNVSVPPDSTNTTTFSHSFLRRFVPEAQFWDSGGAVNQPSSLAWRTRN
jgi:hypothetical protein